MQLRWELHLGVLFLYFTLKAQPFSFESGDENVHFNGSVIDASLSASARVLAPTGLSVLC